MNPLGIQLERLAARPLSRSSSKELGSKLRRIDHLTLSPDSLGPLLNNLLQAGTEHLEGRHWDEHRQAPPRERLLAINEVFIGHRTHQSAKYRIRVGEREERQLSSGLIVATGTGATPMEP